MRKRIDDQVELITSLPTEAGRRVHKLTQQAIVEGTRAKTVARQIQETGKVAAARAMLIARTEVARTAATLTMERAKAVGSDGYIWRTVGDSDVRDAHAEMEGKFVRWDANGGEGAKLSDGTTTHAGCIWNCRCYPEPVLPEFI
jgi:SPP1 gp7 family putative phage head morphogenesis protein